MSQLKFFILIVLLTQVVACGQKGALLKPIPEKLPAEKTDVTTHQEITKASVTKEETIQ